MKNITLYLCICVGFVWNVRADDISIKVIDEDQQSVTGADVIIEFVRSQQKDSKAHYGKTDKEGRFSASGRTLSLGVFVKITKSWYYEWRNDNGVGRGDHYITVVLRKVKNPVPLYVRKTILKFPAFDKWLGFDFEAGDWVAPHGKGKSGDILFKFHREYRGSQYSERELAKLIPRVKKVKKDRGGVWNEEEFRIRTAEWESKFYIAFPSDLEGIIDEKEGYLINSKMKMPHLAPEDGYRSGEIKIEKKSYRSKEEEAEELRKYIKFGEDKPVGYFIRTRVTEVNGKITKANYVKLPNKIGVGASGVINFIYYFNPTLNDRNLEYVGGREKNLAKGQGMWFEP